MILPAQRIEGELGLQAVGLNGTGDAQAPRQALGERFQQGVVNPSNRHQRDDSHCAAASTFLNPYFLILL